MTDATRTMLIQSMGLVGVQMTPDIAETIIEIYRKIEATSDISLKEVEAIAKASNEKYGPPPTPPPPDLKKVDGDMKEATAEIKPKQE